MKGKLPLAALETALKRSGAKRVGESAKTELQKILNRKIEDITKKSVVFCSHAGRKTIKKEDIDMVVIP